MRGQTAVPENGSKATTFPELIRMLTRPTPRSTATAATYGKCGCAPAIFPVRQMRTNGRALRQTADCEHPATVKNRFGE